MHCGSGFWGGQRPSLAHYVTGMGSMAEVVHVAYPPDSPRSSARVSAMAQCRLRSISV